MNVLELLCVFFSPPYLPPKRRWVEVTQNMRKSAAIPVGGSPPIDTAIPPPVAVV